MNGRGASKLWSPFEGGGNFCITEGRINSHVMLSEGELLVARKKAQIKKFTTN